MAAKIITLPLTRPPTNNSEVVTLTERVVTLWAELPPPDATPAHYTWFQCVGRDPQLDRQFTGAEEQWFEEGTSVDFAPKVDEWAEEPTFIRATLQVFRRKKIS